MNRKDLEKRLIDFSVMIINLGKELEKSKTAHHLFSQLLRSGTGAALNYGEAQSAESKKDFIHKMQIVLKELRETSINLRIIEKANLCSKITNIHSVLSEGNELISIFVKSISTSKKSLS